MLDVESVQRNVFKCLKICARLSKLHGYDIHLMWQVIQQAYNSMHRFTAERAQAIDKWHVKLTNRIRMMAVAPAADGSAPQRLPSVPPRELLEAQTRERLLPLPEISVSALNDSRFDRAAGVSSAEYYISHSLGRRQMPAEETSLELAQGAPLAGEEQVDSAVSNMNGNEDQQVAIRSSAGTVAANGSASASSGGPSASTLSTREAELAIIEHQLRELESMPAHSMGPMLRAALNLLVEMRFRLQLGLPRTAIAQDTQVTAGDSASEMEDTAGISRGAVRAVSRINSRNISSEAFGADANEENRVIEYVLNQISNSRRNQEVHAATATNANAAGGFGAPLYMMPHHMGMYFPGMRPIYRGQRETSQEAGVRGIRRRRRARARTRARSDTDVSEGAASEGYGRVEDEEDDYESSDDDDEDDYDNEIDDDEDDGNENGNGSNISQDGLRNGNQRRQQQQQQQGGSSEGHVHRRLRHQ
ncbi:hypothetical protein J3B02_005258 [Coemansia erecta]|nr:hypothetical protein J3B02_005258 [Coemansia erecta]KAJ2881515.1 hypothetical protein FB639_002599 [Coemansia asiatica]